MLDFLRKILGIHSVTDGSTCRLKAHDYPVSKGGDGTPSHFYMYRCWKCGKEFSI